MVLRVQEHILRLDIAVDQVLVMGILQGRSDLLDIGEDRGRRVPLG